MSGKKLLKPYCYSFIHQSKYNEILLFATMLKFIFEGKLINY